MDGQQHEVEYIGVQQCERYPSSSKQPLEARYPDVQQVLQNTFCLLKLFLSQETGLVFSLDFGVSRAGAAAVTVSEGEM